MNACPARGGRFCCFLGGEGRRGGFRMQNSKCRIQNAEFAPKVCFLTARYEVRE